MRRRYLGDITTLVGCANCGLGYPVSEMHQIDADVEKAAPGGGEEDEG